MTQIDLITSDQVLTAVRQPTIGSGDRGTVQVLVEFDAFWDGYTKSAVFFTDKNPTVYEVILDNGRGTIPHEVLTAACRLYIGVRGVNSSRVKTSTLVRYKIVEGAPAGTGTSLAPSATVYQQLLTQLQNVKDELQVERNRINVIASLPEGSTTADAELEDIRVGYNGTVYGNAGEAVRGQIRAVNARIDNMATNHIRDIGLTAPPIIGEVDGSLISVSDASNQLLPNLRIFGRTTQDGTPNPAAPVELVSVGTGGTIETKIVGKNIAPGMVYSSFGKDYASLVFCNDTSAVKKGELYTISVTLSATADTTAYWNSLSNIFQSETIQIAAGSHRYSRTFVALADGVTGAERILLSKSATGDGVVITPAACQIELGATSTDYDATAIQSMAVSTPNGLRGIPVTSGGNYTDAEGQQWICDEVDLARGMYVQRIGRAVLDGSSPDMYSLNAMHGDAVRFDVKGVVTYARSDIILCTHLPAGSVGTNNAEICNIHGLIGYPIIQILSSRLESADVSGFVKYLAVNPMTIYYALATPIETALTDEEIAAFAALHTNKPNTIIYNDAGAYMDVEYVMDAQKYIDSKISAGILAATLE